jgi:hypothetical protein
LGAAARGDWGVVAWSKATFALLEVGRLFLRNWDVLLSLASSVEDVVSSERTGHMVLF